MRFRNREHAGEELAHLLEDLRGNERALLLALPRGGVPVALEISRRLGLPMGMAIARKIGHPYSPEYAVGAVSEHGDRVLNRFECEELDSEWLECAVRRELERAKQMRLSFRDFDETPVEGKIAILIDDGLATGYTIRAAGKAMRRLGATRVVAAVPVAPAGALGKIQPEIDELLTVVEAKDFDAVGRFYEDFEQVTPMF